MSKADPAEEAAVPIRGGRPYLVLIALVLGLLAGVVAQRTVDALLVTGVAAGAEAARAGRIAARSVLWFVILCTASAVFGAVVVVMLTNAFPLPQAQAQAMQTGLAGLDQSLASGPMPGVLDFFKGVVPGNVISAAANGEVLPLVVFALLFALAVSRLEAS